MSYEKKVKGILKYVKNEMNKGLSNERRKELLKALDKLTKINNEYYKSLIKIKNKYKKNPIYENTSRQKKYILKLIPFVKRKFLYTINEKEAKELYALLVHHHNDWKREGKPGGAKAEMSVIKDYLADLNSTAVGKDASRRKYGYPGTKEFDKSNKNLLHIDDEVILLVDKNNKGIVHKKGTKGMITDFMGKRIIVKFPGGYFLTLKHYEIKKTGKMLDPDYFENRKNPGLNKIEDRTSEADKYDNFKDLKNDIIKDSKHTIEFSIERINSNDYRYNKDEQINFIKRNEYVIKNIDKLKYIDFKKYIIYYRHYSDGPMFFIYDKKTKFKLGNANFIELINSIKKDKNNAV